MLVAIYARVSTDRGEQDPHIQVDALKRWIEANGHSCGDVFIDHISGSKRDRPALDRLFEYLPAVHAVAVVKLDRLGRSTRDLIDLIIHFEEAGVDLMVKDQQIDTSTPAGKLMFHIIGAFAEFERDLISDRTKAGLAYARTKGVVLGRPRSPIDTHLARRLVHEHGTISAAARILGVPRRTLSDRLNV